uniref:Uncharacterized protein n=1 Tax=Leptospirillum ferrodiazotrophum TaxID=412449 RepID=C6HVU2_9BACT|nr:MAG: protein of unknown function [Leptospirillum ferrodiazotrophum]
MAELKSVAKQLIRLALGAALISGTVVACTTAGGSSAFAGGDWWETGKVGGYPSKDYLTAIGYGSTLSRAQKDAARNIASQLDSNIHSQYRQTSNRSGMSVSRDVSDALSVKTHAKLYGLRNIRGRFVSSQGSYVAVVGIKRNELARYLRGRINNLRSTIDGLNSDLSGTSDPMRQIHDLAGIVRTKEKAAFFDREWAVVTGGTPSNAFGVEGDLSRLESLLSRHMTVSVDLRNGCGGTDRFVRHVASAITDSVTHMGLLVVPSGGQILIGGTVSARPMESGFSRRYKYYVLHYALTMAAPDGTVWGSRVAEHKVAALTATQGELLAVREVAGRGVGPLLEALKSRLFLTPGDPQFVSFPSDSGGGASAVANGTPSAGHQCDDFRSVSGDSSSPATTPSLASSPSPEQPVARGHVRVIIRSVPSGANVTINGYNPYANVRGPFIGAILGQTPLTYDLPLPRVEDVGLDANGNPVRHYRWGAINYDVCFSSQGFQPTCQWFRILPGTVNRLPVVTLSPQ